MLDWIVTNAGTLVISLVLIGIVVSILVILRRERKNGMCSCGGKCGSCPMSGECHHDGTPNS